MTVELRKDFRFEAAHWLPEVPPTHKCARLHGHSFRVEVVLSGEVDPQTGWLVDFADVDRAFAPLMATLDHHTLNEIDGLGNPTSEVLAAWIFRRLRGSMPLLAAVTVWETADACCTYRGS